MLFTAVVGFLVIGDFEASPLALPTEVDRFPLGSLAYLAGGLQITALVLIASVWISPVWTLVWMAPVAWLLPYGESAAPTQWRALALVCLAVLLLLAVRSRRAVPEGARHRVTYDGAFESSWAFQRARLGWLAVAGGVAVALGLLVAHEAMLSGARDFEERAENAVVEVVSYDSETHDMVVRLDGREFTLEEPDSWEQPAVGGLVPVLVDPRDPDEVRLLVSLEDPSWLVGLAVAAPLAGLWCGLPIILRARRRRDLIARGAPATAVRLACSDEGDFSLLPTDADVPVLHVVHFAGLVPSEKVSAFINDWDERSEDPQEDDDEPEQVPESDEALAGWADGVKDEWKTSDDDESPHFSPGMTEDEKLMAEADFGPDVRVAEPFVMLGSWGHGDTVALLRPSGQAWLAEIEEPRFSTGARPLLPWARTAAAGKPTSTRRARRVRPGLVGKVGDTFSALIRSNFRWVRWTVALGTATVAALFLGGLIWNAIDDGGGFFDWLRPLVFGGVLMGMPLVVTDWVCDATTGRTRQGLASYGFLLDDIIARDRLVSVIPGQDAIAIRMKDPEDALAVFPEDVGPDLDPGQAAEELRRWFASGPADARSGRRPSPVLVAGVLQVILTAAFSFWFLG